MLKLCALLLACSLIPICFPSSTNPFCAWNEYDPNNCTSQKDCSLCLYQSSDNEGYCYNTSELTCCNYGLNCWPLLCNLTSQCINPKECPSGYGACCSESSTPCAGGNQATCCPPGGQCCAGIVGATCCGGDTPVCCNSEGDPELNPVCCPANTHCSVTATCIPN